MKNALLFTVLLAFSLELAAKVEMRTTPNRVEITGGAGPSAWTLTYGTGPDYAPQLLELSPERAYFAHAGWLRLIDTTRGVVLGRWHVGPKIVKMKPAGDEQVEAEVLDQSYR